MGKKGQFNREEKIAAVKLVESGRSVLSVANEYGVHENTIYKWQSIYAINPEKAFTGETLPDADKETERLKRRVRELELEVDFLKKVSAYFAKDPK